MVFPSSVLNPYVTCSVRFFCDHQRRLWETGAVPLLHIAKVFETSFTFVCFKWNFFSRLYFSIHINRFTWSLCGESCMSLWWNLWCGQSVLEFSGCSWELQTKSESSNIKTSIWALKYAKGFNLTSICKLNEYTIHAPSCFLSCL